MSTLEIVSDVQRLVDVARLSSIETVALSAERRDSGETESDEDFEIAPEYDLTITLRDDFGGFRAQLATAISVPIGDIRCVIYAEYELDNARIGSESTTAMGEFINGVALMHVIPFTRQAISDLTMRVFNNPLLMPIIQRGDLGFALQLNPDSPLYDKLAKQPTQS